MKKKEENKNKINVTKIVMPILYALIMCLITYIGIALFVVK